MTQENDDLEWLDDASISADGFWKPGRKEAKGAEFTGILLLHRTVDQGGKSLGSRAFYIFELLEDVKDHVYDKEKQLPTLKKGQRMGVPSWKLMDGISRRLGHRFRVVYLGQRRVKGNPLTEVKMWCSRLPVKEINRLNTALVESGDREEDNVG